MKVAEEEGPPAHQPEIDSDVCGELQTAWKRAMP